MATLARERGVPVAYASERQLEREKIRVPFGVVPVGSVGFVKHALRQFGKSLPEHTPYPALLAPFLHRRVQKLSTLREAKALLAAGQRLFIKPAEGWKRFTGFVAEFEDDYRFSGTSGNKPVWISEPVRFVSEWRAYVADGRVLDVRFVDHGGDRQIQPDIAVINDAVRRLETVAGAARGYVADFGVLESGTTALVELNDGFSMGAYDDLPMTTYWSVTVCRWQQLVDGGYPGGQSTEK